jgi:hypothetical protein
MVPGAGAELPPQAVKALPKMPSKPNAAPDLSMLRRLGLSAISRSIRSCKWSLAELLETPSSSRIMLDIASLLLVDKADKC